MMPVFEYHTSFHSGAGLLLWTLLGSVITVTLLARLALFLLRGFSLDRIARRRGLRNAWLSWIPVGQDWIRGSVSDQFRYLTAGQIRHRRIALSVASAAYLVLRGIGTAAVCSAAAAMLIGFGRHFPMTGVLPMVTGSALGGVTLCLWAVRAVLHHLCMYDLYRSAEPKNDTAMTLLGILFPILEPFFLFYVREMDAGMPPRRDRPCADAHRSGEPDGEKPVDAVYESPDTHFEDPE